MDAAALVVDALNAANLGFDIYHEVPADRPDEFAVVELTGGGSDNRFTSEPAVDVDCWAKSRRRSCEMADACRKAMFDLPGTHQNVFHVQVTSTYNNPDLDSGTPRCTSGFVIYADE